MQVADINYISKKIQDAGYKVTEQRSEIVKVMLDNKKHMNVYEIYEKVKNKNVGLTTIYRTLNILENIGVVNRISEAIMSYYELHTVGEIHIHAKCVSCNKVIDIRKELCSEKLSCIINSIVKEYGFTVNNTEIIYSGICEMCKSH